MTLPENWIKLIKSRVIVVWGCGYDAPHIVSEIEKKGSVDFFVSRDWHTQAEYMGKEVFNKEILDKRKHFIVVGTMQYAHEVSCELLQLGFVEDVDFITCSTPTEEDKYNEIHKRLLICESLIDGIIESITYNHRHCPACKNEFKFYLPFGVKLRKEAQCPYCKSLERHRALWLYFEKNLLFPQSSDDKKITLLHFAPESVFYNALHNHPNVDYYPVDYNPNFKGIRDVIDIQQIKYPNDMFDIIISNNVLEHVPDDHKAVQELYRVLKYDGVAFINCPTNNFFEKTLEAPEYNTPELRRKHYGQSDHLRKYGKDYTQRLINAGFIVNVKMPNDVYSDSELMKYGLLRNETIYECTKAKQ
ncbi:MAG: class I SAM-dependent methyltransferase [Defluviitaleaceae bacterium]|nr:class I SAM-dependent methyltransferase [Defluviitaleaceae bacterium]MCL2239573.1 class I SAM-dependent methyltransferase [Defluviitaleaceae bacterium]